LKQGAFGLRSGMIYHLHAFEELKSLTGQWRGTSEAGRTLIATYTLHAKASVLMEHWQLGETTDALTLYHMDGEVLMATHYCPLCNQPRLNLVYRNDEEMGFEFVSATNLPDASHGHQHSFQFRLTDDDTFWRSETYVGEGAFREGVVYRRVRGFSYRNTSIPPRPLL
jgi:hypothetical protein